MCLHFRESAAGINRLSYFLAVNLAYIPMLLISPFIYLSIYYNIAAFVGMSEFVCVLYKHYSTVDAGEGGWERVGAVPSGGCGGA